MTAAKSLPTRPSLDSLRKQAKRVAKDRSLSLREAQLALAREYGFAGWRDLTEEVGRRLGTGLDWAVTQARRVIHDNDVDGLKRLLAEYPALLSWQGNVDESGVLGFATGAYGDAGTPERERWFTRAAAAELLIDAGAVVAPAVCEGILQSRARGLLELFHRKGRLPRTLKFLAALGDLDAVRARLDEGSDDVPALAEAFVRACAFQHESVAALLLDRVIAVDADLGDRVDRRVGRPAFVTSFIETPMEDVREIAREARASGLWTVFVTTEIGRALHAGDLTAFVDGLRRERWLLGDAYVPFQVRLVETATLNDRGAFITTLFDLDPALLRRQPPPPSQAIEFACTYANTDLLPLLTRIWPIPDDLPHAAAVGNLVRVTQLLETAIAPPPPQDVLDVALAYSVINRHFDAADVLLAHGANIDTTWNSHEPASILHHLVFLPDPGESMRFLVDRGIDLGIRDYRWNATAAGWARHALKDEQMAEWLEEAARRQE